MGEVRALGTQAFNSGDTVFDFKENHWRPVITEPK